MLAGLLLKSVVILVYTVDSRMVRQLFTDVTFDRQQTLTWAVIGKK